MSEAPLADFGLVGKVALITGGSRGLGQAIALGYAAAGADVVIASRKLEDCERSAREVERLTGRAAHARQLHVGKWDQIDRFAEDLWAEFGTIDVLVNNAGMSPLYPGLTEVSEELFDKVVGVNLKGPFRLSALLGTRMAGGDGGNIVNISSLAAVRPRAEALPYAAAKAGLNAMTIGLARALAPGVRVNCIMPGPFDTDFTATSNGTMAPAVEPDQALRRMGSPSEVVGAALYLASSAASFTTGTVMAVDGGMS